VIVAALVFWQALSPTERVAAGARAQLASPARYDASYRAVAYPGGDVPLDRGACTDVVVRAYRTAGYDLQELVHRDMKSRRLPTDTNIDHRRVRNQAAFFKRHGESLALDADWQPGDVVCWKLDSGLDHTGVVSWKKSPSGRPLVVHNISWTKEEDVLTKWKIVGHYRYP